MRFLSQISVNTAAMDYSAAVASAVAWLGNRYLLARPVKRLTPEERCSAELAAVPSVRPDPAARPTGSGGSGAQFRRYVAPPCRENRGKTQPTEWFNARLKIISGS